MPPRPRSGEPPKSRGPVAPSNSAGKAREHLDEPSATSGPRHDDNNADAASSAAAAPARPMPQRSPCGRTRAELDELLKASKYGDDAQAYGAYFFNVSKQLGEYEHKRGQFNIDSDDDNHRCFKCGCSIGEHRSAPAPIAAPPPPPPSNPFHNTSKEALLQLLKEGKVKPATFDLSCLGSFSVDLLKELPAFDEGLLTPAKDNNRCTSEYAPPEAEANCDPFALFVAGVQSLMKERGHQVDKSALLSMGTTGTRGSGKTHFLRRIQSCDTLRHSTPFDIIRPAYRTLQSSKELSNKILGASKCEELVVLFATFGPGEAKAEFKSGYMVELRTIRHMMNDYLCNSDGSDVNFTGDPQMRFPDLCQCMREYVAWRRRRDRVSMTPKDVAVVLCIDDVRNISGDEVREHFVDWLGPVQQGELRNGFSTFTLVSSLDLHLLKDQWVTWSRRSMLPIPVPPLDPQPLVAECICLYNERCDDDTQLMKPKREWAWFARAVLEGAGGHANTLGLWYNKLRAQAMMMTAPPSLKWWEHPERRAANPGLATKMWKECVMVSIMNPCGGKVVSERNDDIDQKTDLGELLRGPLVTSTPLSTIGWDGTPSLLETQYSVCIRPILTHFMSYAWNGFDVVVYNERGEPTDQRRRRFGQGFVPLLMACLFSPPDGTKFEHGTIAALALRARAFVDCLPTPISQRAIPSGMCAWTECLKTREVGPTLSDVFTSSAKFTSNNNNISDDDVHQWRVPIMKRFNPVQTDDLWGDDAKRDSGAATTLVRFAKKSKSDAVVTGCIELVDLQRGGGPERALGWFSSKLYTKDNSLTSASIDAFVSAFRKFKNETHTAEFDKHPDVKHCLILFCTGETSDAFNKYVQDHADDADDFSIAFVGTSALEEILRPFGALALLEKYSVAVEE